jgi:hypothetical protein
MKIFLIIIGVILGLIVLGVVGMFVYSDIMVSRYENELKEKAGLVLDQIETGKLDADAIQKICKEHPEYRRYLYTYMDDTSKFPVEFATELSAAETDMIIWLMHPNELDARPAVIEFVEKIDMKYDSITLTYYLFRYKTDKSHYAYENGWMAGVSGPYRNNTPLYEKKTVNGTYSEFEPFSKLSNRQHVEQIHRKMVEAGQYEWMRE